MASFTAAGVSGDGTTFKVIGWAAAVVGWPGARAVAFFFEHAGPTDHGREREQDNDETTGGIGHDPPRLARRPLPRVECGPSCRRQTCRRQTCRRQTCMAAPTT